MALEVLRSQKLIAAMFLIIPHRLQQKKRRKCYPCHELAKARSVTKTSTASEKPKTHNEHAQRYANLTSSNSAEDAIAEQAAGQESSHISIVTSSCAAGLSVDGFSSHVYGHPSYQ